MRVDFVIGGTQKGGTSALDSFLRQHPGICMPTTRKELHFFDREEENRDYKKYHANFKPKPQHRVYSYIDRGFYAHQVRRLFNIFGKENVLVLLSEELRNQHQKTLGRVFEFLGVDPSFVPPEASVFEQEYSDKIDNQMRARLIDTFCYDIKELERLVGRDLSSWYAKT